jgi:ParB-like chromosome segregation protein Spo0J
LKIEQVDIELLIPDPDNARKHGEKNMQAIRGSIKKFDMVEPLIVRRQNNVVIGGNGRLEALKELGYKTVPVNYIDYDDQKSKALALALNRTAELAEWDQDILGGQLQALFEDGFEIGEFGFDDCDFLKSKSDSPFENEESEKSNNDKMIMCPNCSHSFAQK